MKITLLLISITLLSACSMQAENTKEIESLKSQINILKNENVTLREENTLLKAGGVPQGVNIADNSILPAGTTFEESNSQDCLKKAYEHFITEGNSRCMHSGYNTGEIAGGQCKLSKETIDELNTLRKNEESTCSSLYQ